MSNSIRISAISDLNMNYLQHDVMQIDENSADMFVLSGAISNDIKRSLLFAENTAKKAINKPVVLNMGLREFGIPRIINEPLDSTFVRVMITGLSPKNLSFPRKPTNIAGINFLSIVGWPLIENQADFENSYFPSMRISQKECQPFYIGDRLIAEDFPKFIDKAQLASLYNAEKEKIRSLMQLEGPKVLLLGIARSGCIDVGVSNYVSPAQELEGVTIIECGKSLTPTVEILNIEI